jgi:hypothetical protein
MKGDVALDFRHLIVARWRTSATLDPVSAVGAIVLRTRDSFIHYTSWIVKGLSIHNFVDFLNSRILTYEINTVLQITHSLDHPHSIRRSWSSTRRSVLESSHNLPPPRSGIISLGKSLNPRKCFAHSRMRLTIMSVSISMVLGSQESCAPATRLPVMRMLTCSAHSQGDGRELDGRELGIYHGCLRQSYYRREWG